jgi:hypothetical protein
MRSGKNLPSNAPRVESHRRLDIEGRRQSAKRMHFSGGPLSNETGADGLYDIVQELRQSGELTHELLSAQLALSEQQHNEEMQLLREQNMNLKNLVKLLLQQQSVAPHAPASVLANPQVDDAQHGENDVAEQRVSDGDTVDEPSLVMPVATPVTAVASLECSYIEADAPLSGFDSLIVTNVETLIEAINSFGPTLVADDTIGKEEIAKGSLLASAFFERVLSHYLRYVRVFSVSVVLQVLQACNKPFLKQAFLAQLTMLAKTRPIFSKENVDVHTFVQFVSEIYEVTLTFDHNALVSIAQSDSQTNDLLLAMNGTSNLAVKFGLCSSFLGRAPLAENFMSAVVGAVEKKEGQELAFSLCEKFSSLIDECIGQLLPVALAMVSRYEPSKEAEKQHCIKLLRLVAEMLTALFPVMTACAALAKTIFMESMWEKVLKLPLNARQIEVLFVCQPSEKCKVKLLDMYIRTEGAKDNPGSIVVNIPSINNFPELLKINLVNFMLEHYQSASCREWMIENITCQLLVRLIGTMSIVFCDDIGSIVSSAGNVKYMTFNQVLALGKDVLEKEPRRSIVSFGALSAVEEAFVLVRKSISDALKAIKSNKPFDLTPISFLETIHKVMDAIFTDLALKSPVVPKDAACYIKQLFCLQALAVVLREFVAIQLVGTNDDRKPSRVGGSQVSAQEGVAESKANSAENEEGDGIRMTDVKATFTGASAAVAVSTSVSSIASDAKRCGAG